jgi:hypothetical protein
MRRLLPARDLCWHHRYFTSIVPLLSCFLLLAATGAVNAQSTTWVGGGTTDNWSDATNWTGGVPGNGWDVNFSAVGGNSIMDIAALSLGQLDMTGYGGWFTIQHELWVNTTGAVLSGFVEVQGNDLFFGGSLYIEGYVETGNGSMDVGGSLTIDGDLMGGGSIMVNADIDGHGMIEGPFFIETMMSPNIDFSNMADVDMRNGSIIIDNGDLTLAPFHRMGDVLFAFGGSITTVDFGQARITGNLEIFDGAVDISNAELQVDGDVQAWSGGSFVNSSGAGKVYEINGDIRLDSGGLVLTAASCELHMGPTTTIDANGTSWVTIDGGSGAGLITMDQDGTPGGSRWTIDHEPTATVDISWASIQDGYATPSMAVHNCSDDGNNVGFLFGQEIEVSATLLDFGPVPVDTTATDTLFVYNRGSADLTISSITNNLTQFVASPTSFVIAGGDSQLVEVDFTPDFNTSFVDSLTISSDDPLEPTVVVALTGTGVAADLEITIFTSSPEAKMEGEEVTVSYLITNIGNFPAGPFRASVRASADSVITAGDFIVDTLGVALVPEGMDTSITRLAPLPKGIPRGDVYLGVIADDLGQVVELDEDNNTAHNPFTYQVPSIHSVIDVPYDQGGSVFMSWYASPLDPPGGITEYTLWRTIDVPPAAPEEIVMISGAGEWSKELGDRVIRVENTPAGPIFWEHIATHGAFRRDAYGMELPSMFDSTGAGFQYQYFQVIAHTAYPDTFYLSAADSGYSVDNLAPAAPQGLVAEQSEPEALQLTWDANTEADLSHYAVYRGTDANFTPGEHNRLGEPAEPGYTDAEWRWDSGYYYKVTALDAHGNESPVAMLGPGGVVGAGEAGPPRVSYLSQSRPNPFGIDTRIEYGLAETVEVTIRVYDVAGRLVRTLVDARRAPDHYSVVWDGRDDGGRVVAGGVYFCRITAGAFEQTKKMTLLR